MKRKLPISLSKLFIRKITASFAACLADIELVKSGDIAPVIAVGAISLCCPLLIWLGLSEK